jgi:hypothetical protein
MLFLFFSSVSDTPLYAVLIVLCVSGLSIYMANNLFFGHFGSLDKIFMSYFLFFIVTFYFVNTSVATAFSTTLPTFTPPICNTNPSDVAIIGALINFVSWFKCGITYYYAILTNMFNFGSTIPEINTFLIIPLIMIGVFKFVDLVKP